MGFLLENASPALLKKHGRNEFWIFFGFVFVEFFKGGDKLGIVILAEKFLGKPSSNPSRWNPSKGIANKMFF